MSSEKKPDDAQAIKAQLQEARVSTFDLARVPRPMRRPLAVLLRQRGVRFVLVAAAYSVAAGIVTLPSVLLLEACFGMQPRAISPDQLPMSVLVAVSIIPLIEVFLFQVIPIAIARRFTKRAGLLATVSIAIQTIICSFLVPPRLAEAAVTGAIMAVAFVHWLSVSWRKAYWMTVCVRAAQLLGYAILTVLFGVGWCMLDGIR